jgi:hypothetical protein
MFKNIAIAATAGLTLALAGCSAVNSGAQKAGVDAEFVNVYEGVSGFTDNAYVTIRLYEATLDAAIFACDVEANPVAVKTPDEVCVKASEAAEKLSPAVEVASRSIGTYLYLDGKVNELMADGKVVPQELLQAASEAFYKAKTEWGDIEADVKAYTGQ